MLFSEALPIVGALIFTSVTILRILDMLVKYLIKKFSKKRNDSDLIKDLFYIIESKDISVLSDKESEILTKLMDLHDRYDDEGVPVWYNRDEKETLNEILMTQKKILWLLSHNRK